MSLLDDVSVVVTPNGYKAGTLYGVLPTATEGSEIITNGGFATDSDWTKGTGITIGSGVALFTSVSSGLQLSQSGTEGVVGKRYKISYEIKSRTEGAFSASMGTTLSSNQNSEVGVYTEYLTATGTGIFYIRSRGTTSGSIDNVTVKEVTNSDMDVTRATAATRVDEDGLVNYAEIKGSELIPNGTFQSNVDGWTTNNANATFTWQTDKTALFASTSFAYVRLNPSLSLTSAIYKVSFDILSFEGTLSSVHIGLGSSGNTVTTTGSYSYYITASGTTEFQIRPNGGGTGSIKIDNISVKECTRNNVPRIDYTGGGCPHILAEPQRTNLLTYSEDFSSGIWGNYNSTVTSSVTTAPDGLSSGSKFSGTADVTAHTLFLNAYTVVASNDYTYSVFAKKNESNFIQINTGSGFSNLYANFDLDNGVVGNFNTLDANIESYSNGWFKCSVKANSSTTTGQTTFSIIESLTDARNPSFNALNKSVYIWGAQLEEGSYPTSYIPTSGSTVTRNKDQFTRDGIASLINSTEGVLFIEMAALSDDSTFRSISISDGTYSNRCVLRYGGASNRLNVLVLSGGSSVFDSNSILSNIKNFNKIAVKWKANDFAFWVNGVEVATDTSGNAPIGLSQLQFADSINSSSFLFGKVKQLQVYKTALTDAQLTSLTT